MFFLHLVLCILLGYLVGGINPSYLIGKIKGFDIRKRGSGNAGASNAMILMGKAVGVFSALFDIFKAAACMWLAPVLFPSIPFAAELAGSFCILGHIFPVYMKFRGGKGLACLGGMVLAIDWRFFLILLAVEVVFLLAVDYICFVPITAAFIVPAVYFFFGSSGLDILLRGAGGWQGALIICIAMVGILSRHVENIKRIRKGTELHFSFLWHHDKEKEIAEVEKNKQNQ